MSNALTVGQAVEWGGDCYLIKALKPQLGDVELEGKGGVSRTLGLQPFYNLLASGEIRWLSGQIAPVQRVATVKEQQEAEFRLALISFMAGLVQQHLDTQEQSLRLEAFCRQQGRKRPCAKTLERYRHAYATSGFEGLLPSFSRRGGSGWARKQAAKQIAEEVILATFMRDDKLNLSNTAALVNARLSAQSVPGTQVAQLDRKTVARMISCMPKHLLKEGRLDPRTFALCNRQAVRRYDVQRPFERVEVDAKTIDIYCCDELGNRYTQLTLYAMVCAYSSYPIALYVCAGKPSEYTLLKLFESFFTPKDQSFKQRFGLRTDWVAPAALTTVVLDNAVENTSDVVLGLLRQLGIQIEYARIARGDDKGHVESLFRVLDVRLLHKLPGATRSQDKRNANRHARAAAEACYTLEQIYTEIMQFVADIYLHEPREKLGFRFGGKMSIHESMLRALEQFMPLPPPPVEQVKQLILRINRTNRVLQHYGVDFEGFQYHSHALAELARQHEIKKLEILFNPDDCREIFAVNPDDRSLIRLLNKMPQVPAVSFDVAKALRKQYTGRGEMRGQDYQDLYAEALARYTRDSQSRRRKTVTANNRESRERERQQHSGEVRAQLEAQVPISAPPTHHAIAVDNETVVPAPRRERQHG
ncbi:TPA: DDE-type integrase/transposase/recombinase [Pseudomonas aeruginosa]|nr:DDE-type integrase/transposase/recombinase [Pseudomonas aeruginosa]